MGAGESGKCAGFALNVGAALFFRTETVHRPDRPFATRHGVLDPFE